MSSTGTEKITEGKYDIENFDEDNSGELPTQQVPLQCFSPHAYVVLLHTFSSFFKGPFIGNVRTKGSVRDKQCNSCSKVY